MTVRIAKPEVNIREKLAELERPVGVYGSTLMRTETPQDAFSLIGAGRKNRIINGDFQIWQRGTTGGVGSGTRTYSSADRWFNFNAGDSTTRVDVSTESIGGITGRFNYAIKVTGSQNSRILGQCIEGPLPPGNYVYSAWVKFVGSIPQNFYFTNNETALTSANNFAGFYGGTGTTINYAQPDNWSEVALPGVWYKVYRRVTPVSPQLGLGLGFQPIWSSSTSSELWVTGVQVEQGKNPTEFDYRSFGEELALCMRYYENSYPVGSGITSSLGSTMIGGTFSWITRSDGWYGGQHGGSTQFRVVKRGVPVMRYWDYAGNLSKVGVLYGASNVTVNAGTPVGGASTKGFYPDVNTQASTTVFLYWEADAEL